MATERAGNKSRLKFAARFIVVLIPAVFLWAAPASAQQLLGTAIGSDQESADTQLVDDASKVTTTIGSGATLTIRPESGAGIHVAVPSTGSSAPNLEFLGGGGLAVTGAAGSGVISHFSAPGQHSVLDFSGLSSLAFIDNATAGDGGAIFSYSEQGDSSVTLGPGAVFSGNSSGGRGGAIALIGAGNELNISGNSLFQGNTSGGYGGAIYLDGTDSGGNLSLNLGATSLGGDIVFKDNLHITDTPNSVYLQTNGGSANINIDGDGNVYFDDPIYADSHTVPADHSLTKNGAGFVQFRGENYLNPTSASNTGRVDINAGTFRLTSGARFHANLDAGQQFIVANGATLAGGGEIMSPMVVLSTTGIGSAIICRKDQRLRHCGADRERRPDPRRRQQRLWL